KEGGRDCAPRPSERSTLALFARCVTPPSRLLLPSSGDGTVRGRCCPSGVEGDHRSHTGDIRQTKLRGGRHQVRDNCHHGSYDRLCFSISLQFTLDSYVVEYHLDRL